MSMTLTPCPACEHGLSPHASTCPSCGHVLRPAPKEEGFYLRSMNLITGAIIGILGGIAAFALLIGLFFFVAYLLHW